MNPSLSEQQQRADAWQRLAARTARRINLGWWLSRLWPLVLALSVAGGAAVYLLRSHEMLPSWPVLLASLAGGVALGAAGAWGMARRHFLPAEGAMVRLESRMKLHNQLSTAQCGAGPWPEPPARAEDALARDLPRTWLPPLGAAALVAAGFLLPVVKDVFASHPPPPRSHEEMQAMLDQLREAETLDPKALEKLQKELDNLRAQPPSEWYGHHHLEAADSLRSGTQQQLGEMGKQLEKAGAALNSLTQESPEDNARAREQNAADLKAAADALGKSPLALNKGLMEQLSKAASQLKQFNPEQLQQLQEALQKAGGTCEGCSGSGQSDAQNELEKLLAGDGQGQGQRPGDGEKDGPGRGGVQRGPGVAPLPLSADPANPGPGRPDALESKDLSRAGVGDNIGTENVEHELDKSSAGPVAGGAAAGGAGGNAVGTESLLPSDRAVLKKYFE